MSSVAREAFPADRNQPETAGSRILGWDSGRALAWLTLVIVPYYWRILSHQFSVLTGYEGVDQAWAWLNFSIRSIQQGTFPIWDPFARAGFAFAGEMQTGAFYPLYLVFALMPFHKGILSPGFYENVYIATHILCAFFMYLLARELDLSFFPALISGICFSLGGFVGAMSDWMHMLQSGIWLPLLFFFLLRALRSPDARMALSNAALSGLCLAFSILAGGLHLSIMQAFVAVAAIAFHAWQTRPPSVPKRRAAWVRAALLLAVFATAALMGGAVQLLPSAEYTKVALRWLGATAVPANVKIPYAELGDGLAAHSFLALLFPVLPGSVSAGEYVKAYIGVFPLLLAGIAVWKQWSGPWVRFFAGTAGVAFLYALGKTSILYGVLYAVAPVLWMAREANRFTYLADFGLAILAGIGLQEILRVSSAASWTALTRILRWVAIGCGLVLGYYALLGQGALNGWTSFSILVILLSAGLFQYLVTRPRGVWGQFLIVGLILFDLYAFDWTPASVREIRAKNADHMEQLLSARQAMAFLRSREGRPFRVDVDVPFAPSFGDVFGIQMTTGAGVTGVKDYVRLVNHTELLNARYVVRPASATEPGPVYQDASWKIYEKPKAYPRAWIVHDVTVESNPEQLWKKIDQDKVNLHETALLGAPLDSAPERTRGGTAEAVDVQSFEATRMRLKVNADGRGLLVLSEIYYPGWKADVNGKEVPIWKVDGGLRGVVVPAGTSVVTLHYAPASFRVGLALSTTAFVGCPLLAFFWLRRNNGHLRS